MTNDSLHDLQESLAYRYSVYDLLRRIFLWEFPVELFHELVEAARGEHGGEPASCSPEAPFQNYLRSLSPAACAELHHELHIEYTRLFVGPRHLPAPPYESVYRNPKRLMMQDETIDVRQFYRANEFHVTRLNQDPDDTVGIELEFMLALTKSSIDALQAAKYEIATRLLATQQRFVELHLSKWVPSFCDDITNNSALPFWQSVATFLRSFLDEEARELPRLHATAVAISTNNDQVVHS